MLRGFRFGDAMRAIRRAGVSGAVVGLVGFDDEKADQRFARRGQRRRQPTERSSLERSR